MYVLLILPRPLKIKLLVIDWLSVILKTQTSLNPISMNYDINTKAL